MSANPAIAAMLDTYHCQSEQEFANALREIMQNIALLAFSRTDFFSHAAFYGGTALRILYGLDRGSEDMDFTLLTADDTFDLGKYSTELETEFNSFGLHAMFFRKLKFNSDNIQSGFLKSNTQAQLLSIGMDKEIARYFHPQSEIKIKVEVDVRPQKEEKQKYAMFTSRFPFPFVPAPCLPCWLENYMLCFFANGGHV